MLCCTSSSSLKTLKETAFLRFQVIVDCDTKVNEASINERVKKKYRYLIDLITYNFLHCYPSMKKIKSIAFTARGILSETKSSKFKETPEQIKTDQMNSFYRPRANSTSICSITRGNCFRFTH